MIRRLSILFSLLLPLASGAAAEKPNIVLILADDLSYHDLGCYGNDEVETPHIDALRDEGLKFTNAFTATAMCSPTRQQLYTGVFPVRNGAYPNHNNVKPGTRGVAHHLGELGYRTALHGKWHIGPDESFPFERIEEFSGMEEFIGREDDEPYLLVFASKNPHTPWPEPDSDDDLDLTVPPFLVDTPKTRRALAGYYELIRRLDREVGEVLEMVERSGKEDDTLVIFTSEQGSAFPGAKWTCYDQGLRTAMIARWPGMIEPGTESDAMIRYVDVTPTFVELAGGDSRAIDTGVEGAPGGGTGFDGVEFADILRGDSDGSDREVEYTYGVHTTRGIIAGKAYPVRSVSDGRYHLILNLMPEKVFQNIVTEREERHPYWPDWVEKAEEDPLAAKLVQRYRRRSAVQFFDLAGDPFEMKNLADEPGHRDRIAILRAELERWMAQQGDQGVATELAEPELGK